MPDRPHARERLMLAAEEHIATAGIGVALRELALAAGIRNNSAVNYHFGDRNGLIEAIVLARTQRMELERQQLLDQLPANASLRELVGVLVTPQLTVPYAEGSTHYARFMDQVSAHPVITVDIAQRFPASRQVIDRIESHLDLPRAARQRRLEALSSTLFALAADRERAAAEGRAVAGADEIVDMLVGLLQGAHPA